jgi:hypothetical protein
MDIYPAFALPLEFATPLVPLLGPRSHTIPMNQLPIAAHHIQVLKSVPIKAS